MNLMLHGIDNPNFRYTDTLSKSFAEKEQYDVILANPPFKGSIDKSDINERFSTKTTKTELLFIELMYDLLVTGGRCGVIVPDGVLFGTSNAHIALRKILVDKCKLEGLISMPSGVFRPYAGVSTAVLVFQKGGTTDNVWFYDMEADGFSLDDKRQKVRENDIPDIVTNWGDRSKSKIANRKSKIFTVPADEIRSNKYDLSISRYREIEHRVIEYEKPGVIMEKVVELERQIESDIESIKAMIR
jgi:type I restriction enzyme M protein